MTNNPTPPVKPIFLYTTAGDWHGTIIDGFIFDPRGDYIGWIRVVDAKTTALYTFDGEWVGDLYKDGRVVKKRAGRVRPLEANPPAKPKTKRAGLPARAPLPPQTVDLGYDLMDVLEEDPDVFKRVSERRKDLGE